MAGNGKLELVKAGHGNTASGTNVGLRSWMLNVKRWSAILSRIAHLVSRRALLSDMNPLFELDEKHKDPSLTIADTLGSPELGISTLTSSADLVSPIAASEAATASAQVIQPPGVTVSLQLSPSMIDIGSITIVRSGRSWSPGLCFGVCFLNAIQLEIGTKSLGEPFTLYIIRFYWCDSELRVLLSVASPVLRMYSLRAAIL